MWLMCICNTVYLYSYRNDKVESSKHQKHWKVDALTFVFIFDLSSEAQAQKHSWQCISEDFKS